MSDTRSRRQILRAGALAGGALVPSTLAAAADAPAAARGPFDVRDFGATGDGTTPDTAALQGAIDACHRAGGGTVRVSPGVYLTRPIELRSFVTLDLEAGSTILGSPRLEDYAVEGRDASGESERGGVVTARGAERVAIIGRGTIDGNAMAFHDPTKQHDAGDFDRSLTRQGAGFMPKGVRLASGEDAVVRDSRAAAGTDTFVEATDVTGRTVFTGNDVRAARQPVVPASFGRPGGRGRGAQNR